MADRRVAQQCGGQCCLPAGGSWRALQTRATAARHPPLRPARPPCAGVPCLTLAGACHAHNVGVSLLTAVGLEQDWVARSGELWMAAGAAPGWPAGAGCHRDSHPLPLLTPLSAITLPPLRAVDEYVAKAAALTADVQALAALRAGLRDRMLQVRAGRRVAGPAVLRMR